MNALPDGFFDGGVEELDEWKSESEDNDITMNDGKSRKRPRETVRNSDEDIKKVDAWKEFEEFAEKVPQKYQEDETDDVAKSDILEPETEKQNEYADLMIRVTNKALRVEDRVKKTRIQDKHVTSQGENTIVGSLLQQRNNREDALEKEALIAISPWDD